MNIDSTLPADRALVALLVAAVAGYAMLRHAKHMIWSGVTLGDGGGWAVLVLLEFSVALGALGVALS